LLWHDRVRWGRGILPHPLIVKVNHWVFDRGLMTIAADNYHVRLSAQLKAIDLEPGYFGKLRGSEIRLPADALLYPHPLALDWHRKHIFAS